MSISSLFSKNLSWISKEQNGVAASSALTMSVLARGLYVETSRTYKVGYVDLIRVIGNELKLLQKPEYRIVWLIRRFGKDGTEVLFATFSAHLLLEKSTTQILVPETWLLYGLLQPDILYRISDSDNYWAFLAKSGALSVASRAGLMQSSAIFLEALGLADSAVEKREIEIRSILQSRRIALRWWQFPGLLVFQKAGKTTSIDVLSLLPKLKLMCILAFGYAFAISAWTMWREFALQTQLTELKSEASALVSQQQKVEAQVQLLTNHQSFIAERVMHSEVIAEIAKTLQGHAQVQNITVTDRLILIRGEARSATAVLEAFSQSSIWQNPRFTQPVRPVENGESFTLSVMYAAQPSSPKQLGGTGG